MGLYEIGLVIYVVLWLVAVIDAAIANFPRWPYQLGWLFAIFLVPFGNLAYLLFGSRQVVSGGLGLLHRPKIPPSKEE